MGTALLLAGIGFGVVSLKLLAPEARRDERAPAATAVPVA